MTVTTKKSSKIGQHVHYLMTELLVPIVIVSRGLLVYTYIRKAQQGQGFNPVSFWRVTNGLILYPGSVPSGKARSLKLCGGPTNLGPWSRLFLCNRKCIHLLNPAAGHSFKNYFLLKVTNDMFFDSHSYIPYGYILHSLYISEFCNYYLVFFIFNNNNIIYFSKKKPTIFYYVP